MNLHQSQEFSLRWWMWCKCISELIASQIIITLITLHQSKEFLLHWWMWFKGDTALKIKHSDENLYCDKNLSMCWICFTLMNVYPLMKIYHCDENSSLRWKWRWKSITVMKTYYRYKNSLLWWKFIALMKIYYWDITIYHSDENFIYWWKF